MRVETRAFYGATVTLEEGVRVFRPLPPHSRVVINPGGRTPLHLYVEDGHGATHNVAKASATGGAAYSESSGHGGALVGQGKPGHHGSGMVGKSFGGKPAHGPAPARP